MPETHRPPAQALPGSLFRSGLPVRLALALALALPLWAVIVWAMAA